MKAVHFFLATLLLATASTFSLEDDWKKPTPPDQIKLNASDWRPAPEIVFRAEYSESKQCRKIGDDIACGMVPTLEIEEEHHGRVRMEQLMEFIQRIWASCVSQRITIPC